MKNILLPGILCLLLSLQTIFAQNSRVTISEKYGAYEVGFKVYHTYDKSRSFKAQPTDPNTANSEQSFRPMQVCIWYPAQKSGQAPMIYEDYFFLKAHETGEVKLSEDVKEALIEDFLSTDPVDLENLRKELAAPMKAKNDALEIRNNTYPVVIYGPSWWSTAFENSVLCEFLASHGYVVVSSPSMGPLSREMPISRTGVETQARDMEFLLSEISGFPAADTGKLAVAGFSLGGLSNVLMYSRNSMVDAWIGLDPSIHEAYNFFSESPYEEYARFTKPSLFINSAGYMDELPFYDQLVYSDAFVVNLPQLEHTDLASLFIKLYAPEDAEGMKKRLKGYNLTARYFLSFLNGVFKKGQDYDMLLNDVFNDQKTDTSFVKILSKKGLPQVDTLFAKYKDANGAGLVDFLNQVSDNDQIASYPEADIQKLIFLAANNNLQFLSADLMRWYASRFPAGFHPKVLKHRSFDQMLSMFVEVYRKNKSCNFDYEELNRTAQIMSMGGDGAEAIDYFELNTLLHPQEARAYFNLGLGYYRIEDFPMAKLNFNKCLETEPDERYESLALDFLNRLE